MIDILYIAGELAVEHPLLNRWDKLCRYLQNIVCNKNDLPMSELKAHLDENYTMDLHYSIYNIKY
ncbi:MAG: hypothetical protein V4594_21070 [Bacteroidota bacterium]